MTQPKKHVAIHLKTVIQDGSEIEENNVKSTGVWYRKSGLDVLNFKERIDEVEIVTLVTIQKGKVGIKRSGAISMHQHFRLQQETENVYKHPHGNMLMETFTDHLAYEPPSQEKPARLEIDYTMKLNGQSERKHKLELIFTEEDS